MSARARRSLVLVGLAVVVVASGCGVDPISGYDVTITTREDCTQTGISAPQCVAPEDAAARTRVGRWVFEDKGGANLLNPLSSFVLTTDRGRTITGVHFANDGRIQTNQCAGEGGECYFARTRADSVEEDTGCPIIKDRALDMRSVDGTLTGETIDIIIIGFTEEEVCEVDESGAEVCGLQLVAVSDCTTTISQVIVDLSGALADEAVMAREPLP